MKKNENFFQEFSTAPIPFMVYYPQMMEDKQVRTLFNAALTVHEVTGDSSLTYPLMQCCSANGSREADGWLADFYLNKLNRTFVCNLEEWKLRDICKFAIERGFTRLALRCFELCQPGALDDLKWEVTRP